jgi:hypothetical protein
VIRLLLVIQMPDASDERGVAPTFCPIDRFSLLLERAEHVVGVVFDNEIVNRSPFRAPLGTCLNENIRHNLLPIIFIIETKFTQSRRVS